MAKITVGWMYPNILNLHGERGSVQMLSYIGNLLGVEVEIRRIEDFDQPIPFEELDLLMFLPGEISSFRYLVPALENSGIREYVERGGYVLALGTTGLMFGKQVTREDGNIQKGLGILDLTAVERKYVWGDDLHLRLMDSGMELIGSQIMMADVETSQPLGETLYGRGNNGTGTDGARYKNLIYTNCAGPLFVKNPWFAEAILRGIVQEELPEVPENPLYTNATNGLKSIGSFLESKK